MPSVFAVNEFFSPLCEACFRHIRFRTPRTKAADCFCFRASISLVTRGCMRSGPLQFVFSPAVFVMVESSPSLL